MIMEGLPTDTSNGGVEEKHEDKVVPNKGNEMRARQNNPLRSALPSPLLATVAAPLTTTVSSRTVRRRHDDHRQHEQQQKTSKKTFLVVCVAFGIVPGCAVSSLSLAAVAFGRMGARQSSVLFLAYTVSALLMAAPLVKKWTPPVSMVRGMALLSVYPFSLALASILEDWTTRILAVPDDDAASSLLVNLADNNVTTLSHPFQSFGSFLSPSSRLVYTVQATILYMGAVVGGAGAGVMWTAVGVYLSSRMQATVADSRWIHNDEEEGREGMPDYSTDKGDDCADVDSVIVERGTHGTKSIACSQHAGPSVSTLATKQKISHHRGYDVVPSDLLLETNQRAGWLASVLLLEETTLVGSSSAFLVRYGSLGGSGWGFIFGLYAILSFAATLLMHWILVDSTEGEQNEAASPTSTVTPPSSWDCSKLTMAVQLLARDTKAKYLLGLPLVFGVAGGFLNSFVSSQVVPMALSTGSSTIVPTAGDNATLWSLFDDSSSSSEEVGGTEGKAWVGRLAAFHGLVAVATSVLLGGCSVVESKRYNVKDGIRTRAGTQHCSRLSSSAMEGVDRYQGDGLARDQCNNHLADLNHQRLSGRAISILVGGCLALGCVGGAFWIWHPLDEEWTLPSLLALYALHGIGRAAFESTLRATFAALYPADDNSCDGGDSEGAFACILLFNGVGSVASHWLAAGDVGGFSMTTCRPRDHSSDPDSLSSSCDAEYQDRRSMHSRVDVLASLLVVLSVAATLGYVRAWQLFRRERESRGGRCCRLLRWPSSYQAVDDDPSDDQLVGTELREVT
jgi:hypothetical protein